MSTDDHPTDANGANTVTTQLLALRNELSDVLSTVPVVLQRVYKPPVIYEAPTNSSDDDLAVPGLKAFQANVEREIDVLDKYLDRNPSATTMTAISTNAPYFLSVWKEVMAAPEVYSIGQCFQIHPLNSGDEESGKKGKNKQKHKDGPIKVDVVVGRGDTWIRVNTIKNNRLRAELNDMDGYADSDSSADEDTNGDAPENSLLRMGANLIAAARSNPVPGTNSKQFPRVCIRLTRLVPQESEPRIAETIERLKDMGIEVWLGERDLVLESPTATTSTAPSLSPAKKLNLDLSLLVALVSDITHAPLPSTREDAVQRFRPLVKRWKDGPESVEDYPAWVLSEKKAPLGGAAAHSRSLTYQAEQEKRSSLLDEIKRRLPLGVDVEFYTTEEAASRLGGIVDKIGGKAEKRRAEALIGQCAHPEDVFFDGSRFEKGFLPGLVPIRILVDTAMPEDGSSRAPISAFHRHLAETSKSLLNEIAQTLDDKTTAQTVMDDEISSEVSDTSVVEESPDIPRKSKSSTGPSTLPASFTPHTVKSLYLGASQGMTTVTANKASIRAILREMSTRNLTTHTNVHSSEGQLDGVASGTGSESCNDAALWVVEPRSLAENMRVDVILQSPDTK